MRQQEKKDQERFEHHLANPPRSDEDLQAAIRDLTGLEVPNRAVCARHDDPLAFLADQFFERDGTSLLIGAPTSGKRTMLALLNLCDLLFKPGVQIAHIGGVKGQVDAAREILNDLCLRNDYLAHQVFHAKRDEILFTNGSRVRFLNASYAGMSTEHPQKVRLAEIEFLHLSLVNEALCLAHGRNGWRAQTTLTSRRRISAGTVEQLRAEAAPRGIQIYEVCVWENLQRCARSCKADPTHGDCGAASRCGGVAHELPEGGWYPIADFVQKARLIDEESWNTEWTLRRGA